MPENPDGPPRNRTAASVLLLLAAIAGALLTSRVARSMSGACTANGFWWTCSPGVDRALDVLLWAGIAAGAGGALVADAVRRRRSARSDRVLAAGALAMLASWAAALAVGGWT